MIPAQAQLITGQVLSVPELTTVIMLATKSSRTQAIIYTSTLNTSPDMYALLSVTNRFEGGRVSTPDVSPPGLTRAGGWSCQRLSAAANGAAQNTWGGYVGRDMGGWPTTL